MRDVAVIGLGPSGMTAALYLTRSKLDILCFEKTSPGGQIVMTDNIENYPGFPKGISGYELAELFKKQLQIYPVEIKSEEVIAIERKGNLIIKTLSSDYEVLSVIVAAGAYPRRLSIKGEDIFTGRGVSYCATCDANFFKGKRVAVLGGGDSAVEEAIFLSKFVEKLYLIHRRERLRAVGVLQDKMAALTNVEFVLDSVIEEIGGDSKVGFIQIKNLKTANSKRINLDGVFIFAGYTPNTQFLKEFLQLDSEGYIIAVDNFKTSIEGVFTAGDVRSGSLKQVISASGEGAHAAVKVSKYLDKIKGVSYD
ncbi:MAG: thioredoxin-disulfide reductase [Candidatus Kaelpia imicola]|nr:thioredoxin-disulfide reductase [Candidatus Kaelpia imicola]